MSGSSEDGLIDIPSRTSQITLDQRLNTNDREKSTTTDRPSFLPPKETVIGKEVYEYHKLTTTR